MHMQVDEEGISAAAISNEMAKYKKGGRGKRKREESEAEEEDDE